MLLKLHVLIKVVTVMRIAGACRPNELCQMKLENVKISSDFIIVTILDLTNETSLTFFITKNDNSEIWHFNFFLNTYKDIRSKMTIVFGIFCPKNVTSRVLLVVNCV